MALQVHYQPVITFNTTYTTLMLEVLPVVMVLLPTMAKWL